MRVILKRYGSQLNSVTTNFDPNAMNEIGFQKDDGLTLEADEFARRYEQAKTYELTGSAEGDVQVEAEAAVLDQLQQQISDLLAALQPDELLVIESESGRDYPKVREQVSNIVVKNTNRLRFHRTIDPPLRIAVYRARQS